MNQEIAKKIALLIDLLNSIKEKQEECAGCERCSEVHQVNKSLIDFSAMIIQEQAEEILLQERKIKSPSIPPVRPSQFPKKN